MNRNEVRNQMEKDGWKFNFEFGGFAMQSSDPKAGYQHYSDGSRRLIVRFDSAGEYQAAQINEPLHLSTKHRPQIENGFCLVCEFGEGVWHKHKRWWEK